MPTYHLHIKGCVQGVGFRPFVYGLAKRHNIHGWVKNTSNGVHIRFNAEGELVEKFHTSCILNCPPQADITSHELKRISQEYFSEFVIADSSEDGHTDIAITPDFGLCSACREELNDHHDRRSAYPFITCTNCGPRYSIMEGLPYDREKTAMGHFDQCPKCADEYHDPFDRRYYSQTNSCSDCGIEMLLKNKEGDSFSTQNGILTTVGKALKKGEIIAVKGIGGYLLLCDATEIKPISKLRERKRRPEKPFAVMYPNLEVLKGDVICGEDDFHLLSSPTSPILLMDLQEKPSSGLVYQEIAPLLNQVGVMLPYAPLLALIAQSFGKPLVATSANVSGSPIVYQDDTAYAELFTFADWILSHNREIKTPQDDSVIKKSGATNEHVLLRRSRGLAPNFYHELKTTEESILCMGAQMKGSFCVSNKSNIYVSQYLGDLDGFESQTNYKAALQHFLNLTKVKPHSIYCDSHPSYFSSELAEQLAEAGDIPISSVQHHKAHFAAVLGENQLLFSEDKILGVIWDGTGLGDDEQMWGGEFFDYSSNQMSRINHFDYFPILSGDKMAREPRLSSLSLTKGEAPLENKFTAVEWDFYQKAIHQAPILTSSVGRIFDAVASLIHLRQRATFEGQAAMLVEQAARSYLDSSNWKSLGTYSYTVDQGQISLQPMINEMIEDLKMRSSQGLIASKFHQTLVGIVDEMAIAGNYRKLAFSGGVFQNGVLVDLIKLQLGNKYELYFHKQLSPNDENISFGQYIWHLMQSDQYQTKSVHSSLKPEQICV